MGANRETDHDMTQTDIAFLLADAADGVEIGIAPVQAVIRGGRRRRARRWAVAAATTLVLAGSTGGTLALTGLPGGHGDRGTAVATRPASPEARHVYAPQRTTLARGVYHGKEWRAAVELWGAPRNTGEASKQLDAMTKLGLEPVDVHKPADLVGKTSFFVTRVYDRYRPQQLMFNTVKKMENFAGTDLEAVATRLGHTPESSGRLVLGQVADTARQVKCTWKDGTTSTEPTREAVGFGTKWFVCVAPEGTTYKAAEVIQ